MQKFIVAALLAAGLITTPAMAADAPASKATPAYIAGSAIRTDAEVMSIDLPSRKVGLKLEDGTIAEIVVAAITVPRPTAAWSPVPAMKKSVAMNRLWPTCPKARAPR